MRRAVAAILLPAMVAIAFPGGAAAGWQAGGSVSGYSRAETMPAGNAPAASASGREVTVSWTASVLAGGGSLDGYIVKRYDSGGEAQAVGAGCAGTIAALGCTEQVVPPGSWRYTVTPALQGWRGTESARSATVAVPVTISTSAWDLRDASSGVEQNASEPTAFANDELTYETNPFGNAFAANRYVEWDYNSPLPAGVATSSVSFDFRFRAGSETACFHFDVISGGSVIGTHGATTPGTATSPWCAGTTDKLVSTPLPEVSSSDLANGLRIKLYGYESNRRSMVVDEATVSGTAAPSQGFTLHETTQVDSAGPRPATEPWPLAAAGDGALYASAAKWPSGFSGSRYLQLTFPSYVPGGDAVSSVSFIHSYRSAGNTVCWYFEVYSGGSLIGTHGSPAAPVSCNSSTSSFVTDTVALPEVATAAQANGLAIKMYVDNTGSKRSEHDLAELSIAYLP